MARPEQKDIDRALSLLNSPGGSRSAEDGDFLTTFAAGYFNKSPSEMAADEELFPVYLKWRAEQRRHYLPEATIPPSDTYALMPEQEKPKSEKPGPARALPSVLLTDDDILDEIEEEEPAAKPVNAREPRTASGKLLGALAERSSNAQIARFVNRGERDGTWKRIIHLAPRFVFVGVAGAAIIGGTYLVTGIKNAAENVGGKIEQLHTETDDFAGKSGEDPMNAPLPASTEKEEQKLEVPPDEKMQKLERR